MISGESVTTESSPRLLSHLGSTYYPLAMMGRLPFAMTVVGVLTLVVTVTGSFTDAGATSAVVGIGTAVAGPFLGMAADRFGQRMVLLASTLVHSLTLVALTVLTYQHRPVGVLMAAAFVIGASAPQLAAMSRARLLSIINLKLPSHVRSRTLNRTMSVESMADELVFVFGPVAVGVLSVQIAPWAPLVVAAALTLVCVGGFALHPTASVVRRAEHSAPTGSLRDVLSAKILVLAAGMLSIGTFFGSMLTSLTSFMDDRGAGDSAGVVYGALGIGSAIFAIAVVLFPASFTLAARWIVFALVSLVSVVFLPTIHSVPAMVAVLVVLGIGLGPTLVTIFSLGSARAPVGRSATVMTILSSAVVVGQSLLTAVTGRVVDAFGTSVSMWFPIGSVVLMVLFGLWNARIEKGIRTASRPSDR